MHYLIDELPIYRKGKVREVYELPNQMLFVASDRISAFDVIMNESVPDKGKILNSISEFWFQNTKHIIDNHLVSTNMSDYPKEYIAEKHFDMLKERSMLVKKASPLTVEFVVRGYIAGSGWKEYKNNGKICGVELPTGLLEYSKLPEAIFTPATKAETGHDENINFEQCTEIIGINTALYLKEKSIELFNFGSEYLYEKGIILADTKFEFGILDTGEIILIDEILTPDSSRFWLKDSYVPGKSPINFDKQILRDYLETINWNKQYPAPKLPDDIIIQTRNKYIEIYELIIGKSWAN